MAAIKISINTNTDLFTISLDDNEWTNLYIKQNGNWTPATQVPGGFQYVQNSPAGPLQFKAVGNTDIVIVNPTNILFMKGPKADHTYLAVVGYTNINNEVHLIGSLSTIDELMPDAQPSPLTLSQGRLTGVFEVEN